MIESPAATAWYVYGVVSAGASASGDVDVVERGGLAALVREVPLSEFGEHVLPQRLNDRAWLEENVLRHEDVLRPHAGTGVVPLRFGAIYNDVADVERMLDERRAFFVGALARVRGHVELGVKAWLVGPAREPARAAAAGGGRAYLERRRDELAAAQTLRERAGAVVSDAHRTLLAVAVDGVANRPQPRELTGRSDEMIFNAAYLVRSGDESFARTFAQIAPAAAEAGVEFELTGPWPPHNFVREDEEPPA